jgi:hypothetical protein
VKGAPLTALKSKLMSGVTKLKVGSLPRAPTSGGTGVSATGGGNSTRIVLERVCRVGPVGRFVCTLPTCARAAPRPAEASSAAQRSTTPWARMSLWRFITRLLLSTSSCVTSSVSAQALSRR